MAALLMLASCGSESPENIEPTLRTLEAANITRTSATLQGTISLQGSTAMPSLSFLYGSGDLSSKLTASDTGNGIFTASLEGLTAGTTYQYQLVADNGRTTIHANTVTFATLPNNPPTIDSAAVLSSSPVSAIIGFRIPDTGGGTLTDVGCYVATGNATTLADANARKIKADDEPTASGQWRTIITGLTTNSTYTIFPYAATEVGETVGAGLRLTTSNAIVVTAGGDFALMMKGQSADSINVAGPLNGDDIRSLRSLNPKTVNMAGAHIVDGGGPYTESFFTEDNIVGHQFFAGCTRLTSVTLPDNATTIAKDAFQDCTSLTEITIPASAAKVEPSGNCPALSNIKVSAANAHFKSVDGVLVNADITNIVWFPMGKTGRYTLPSTITSIGNYAFSQCSITSFTLPDNITSMGQAVFYGSKVESVRLPAKLQTVPTATFQSCTKLHTVHIGKGTQLISNRVFDGCPITDLYVEAEEPPACATDAFTTTSNDFTQTCTLHVPAGSAKYYKASSSWQIFANITEQ